MFLISSFFLPNSPFCLFEVLSYKKVHDFLGYTEGITMAELIKPISTSIKLYSLSNSRRHSANADVIPRHYCSVSYRNSMPKMRISGNVFDAFECT